MPKAAQDSQYSSKHFPRNNRLLIKNDFQSVFADCRKTSYRYLLVLYRPNQKPHSRLGIIISKNRVKSAVKRNGIRRIIRESFRQWNDIPQGLDLIVLLRSECTPFAGKVVDKKVLRSDIDCLWQRLASSYKPD